MLTRARGRRAGIGLLLLFLPVLLACPRRPAARTSGPPNFLVIVLDDLGVDVPGCYGGTTYQTPRLDALAAAGLRFDAAFSTPLCTPSRVQLLTGRYPFRTGWTDNMLERLEEGGDGPRFLDPAERTFAALLKEAGYATAVAGKWQLCHFAERPEHVKECGFDEYCCWLWMDQDPQSGELVYTSRYWLPSVIQDGVIRRSITGTYGPDLYTDYLIDFMQRNRDRPFLALHNMVLPHPPFEPTAAQLDPAQVTEEPHPADSYFRGMVKYADEIIGRMVDALDELGLAENTVVLVTSDNGTPEEIRLRRSGEMRPGGKGELTAAGTHVPLIASWPGRIAPGRASGALIDLSDFLPTLLELAGAPLPPGLTLDGKSFAPVLLGSGAGARRWVFSQVQERCFVRGGRYKLYDDGRFYDVAADPEEERDLAGDASVAGPRDGLRAVLDSLPR